MNTCNKGKRSCSGNMEVAKTWSGVDIICPTTMVASPRLYRAASPSAPRGEQPAGGLTGLATTCRNPHLSGHILTCRVLLPRVDWQVVVSSTDTHPQQEVCVMRGKPALPGEGSCTEYGWVSWEGVYL